MDLFAKGILQGSVPVIVLVGGTHHVVKKFRESKPVLYWGSLAVATGAAVAVVNRRIPAPFMNAEEMVETAFDVINIEYMEDGEETFDYPEQMFVSVETREDDHYTHTKDSIRVKIKSYIRRNFGNDV